jgi:hypothetical protein
MTQYKQVSPEQVDLWLNDPVTKAYLEAVNYCKTAVETRMHEGGLIDPENNDLTCYNLAYCKGRRDMVLEAQNPLLFLATYERPEVANV